MIRSPLITVITDAVMKASRALKRDFGEVENLQVSRKGPGDFVSAADRRAEQILRDVLEKARPGYSFVLEEGGVVEGTDKSHRWHIDPLDGTTNFLHGVPQFAISVGLERDGQIVAGVVYDPIKDEMFIAERGKGAYLNNRRIRVAAETEEKKSYEERMPDEWLEALAPLGTTWRKPFLETAPWLVVVFEELWGVAEGGVKRKNYYVPQSVGIACGLFVAALHEMGLATLTHTPSPMGFLREILGRPENEKPYILFPVGFPDPGATVPEISKKQLYEIAIWREPGAG